MGMFGGIGRRVSIVVLGGLLATGVVVAGPVAAQTPEASPAAESAVAVPEGPLGVQMLWLVDTLNAGAGKIQIDQINEHFAPAFFEDVKMTELFATLSRLQSAGITYELDSETIMTTRDMPATMARFILFGSDGSMLGASIQVDRETGLIRAFTIQALGEEATPEATPA